MKHVSSVGNWYLLMVVNGASMFLSAFPLESKDAVDVARKRLEHMLTF